MAQRKINGKDLYLFIDTSYTPGGTPSYDKVVCLTSHTFDRTTAVEDASSQCGPDSGPGSQTATITFDGQVVYEASPGSVTESDLDAVWKTSELIAWKLGKVTPATGDVTYDGEGWLSNISQTGGGDGKATFSGTIQVTGSYTKDIES